MVNLIELNKIWLVIQFGYFDRGGQGFNPRYSYLSHVVCLVLDEIGFRLMLPVCFFLCFVHLCFTLLFVTL